MVVYLQSVAQVSVISPGERGGPATKASSLHYSGSTSEKSSSNNDPRYEEVSGDHPSAGSHS